MKKVFYVFAYLGGMVTGMLLLMTSIDVIGRYVFNAPLPGTYDMTGNFLCIIAACGIAAVTLDDEHIQVDSLFSKFSKFWKRTVTLGIYVVQTVVFGFLCWQGWVVVYGSIFPYMEESNSTPTFIIFPFRMALAIGLTLAVIASIYLLVHSLRTGTIPDDEAERITVEII